MKGNEVLPVSIIFLFILSAVFFTLDSPYWYVSILTFSLAILIILIKIMWGIAGWGSDQLGRVLDKNK